MAEPQGADNRDVARDGRNESEAERADRNYNELLQELRVAQTGVQILFAFLLTLPFTQRFGSLTDFQRTLYPVTLLSTTCAAVVLLAPVSFHRVLFRQHERQTVVTFADRALLGGLVLLLIGISSAGLLVLDAVFDRVPAVVGCAVVTLLAVRLWFVLLGWHRGRPSD